MSEYCHHVTGFFANRAGAEGTSSVLVARGLSRERLQIFAADAPHPPAIDSQEKNNDVLKDVLVDGTIGTAVGAGLGALAEVALVAANVTLFVASPLIAPLAMLGWGASLGGLIGAAAGATSGAGNKTGWLADLIRDAIASGQVVLVVDTRTVQETDIAKEVIQAAVGSYKELETA